MYLSDTEEIIAIVITILIVIGFIVKTYQDIKTTIREEKEKFREQKEAEEKVETLIEYLDSKKKLIDTVTKAKKRLGDL